MLPRVTGVTGDPITAKARWCREMLNCKDLASVSYSDHTLWLRDNANNLIESIPSNDIVVGGIRLKHRLLNCGLEITTTSGTRLCLTLGQVNALKIKRVVRDDHRRKEAEPLALELAHQIKVSDQRIANLLSGKKYLQDSEVKTYLSEIKALIDQCDHYVRLSFSEVHKSGAPTLVRPGGWKDGGGRGTSNDHT